MYIRIDFADNDYGAEFEFAATSLLYAYCEEGPSNTLDYRQARYKEARKTDKELIRKYLIACACGNYLSKYRFEIKGNDIDKERCIEDMGRLWNLFEDKVTIKFCTKMSKKWENGEVVYVDFQEGRIHTF
jgi:hypothetical protein